ncbi:hypothetical protein [Streptomyces sp. NBC_01465]|uniref:hypothetical protein n=1 Tax=Streptomyces sp. NBC_01465 TaxID=2903878 RepID=UPI002E324BB0|nr:hypothetical protein [Streptomyces sp. NBC_01465]
MAEDDRAALTEAVRGAAADAGDWRAQLLLSRALLRQGEHVASVRAARLAVELAPGEADAHEALALALSVCSTRGFSLIPLGTGREQKQARLRARELRGPVVTKRKTRRVWLVVGGLILFMALWFVGAWLLWGSRIARNVQDAVRAVPLLGIGIYLAATGKWRAIRTRTRERLRKDPAEARLVALHRVALLSFVPLPTNLIAGGHPSDTRIGVAVGIGALVIACWSAALRWWYGREVWGAGFNRAPAAAHLAVTLALTAAPAVLDPAATRALSPWSMLCWPLVGWLGAWCAVGVLRRRRLRAAIATAAPGSH